MFEIDVSDRLYPDCRGWLAEAQSSLTNEFLGDMLRIRTITDVSQRDPRHPFKILDYFGIKYDRAAIGENVWVHVDDILQQVFTQLLALTGDEYRLDWSREDDKLCLWYRSRSAQHNAMTDIGFARAHSLQTIPDTEIKDSTVHGIGLFATTDVAKDQRLCILDGQWISFDEYERLRMRIAPGIMRFRDYFFMEWNYMGGKVLARFVRTSYGFINHSNTPNVEIRALAPKVLALHSNRRIAAGEEIFIDYRKEDLPRGYLANPSSQYLNDVESSLIRRIGSGNSLSLVQEA